MEILVLVIVTAVLAASAYVGCAKPGTKEGICKYGYDEEIKTNDKL